MPSLIESIRQQPVISFAILLAVILVVPVIFEKLKLPGIIGLLVAGVILGSNGLNILDRESETMKLLSDIGLVYLMFVAGLEVDIEQFDRTKHRSAGFGFLTFIVPLIFGTVVGRIFGFGWNGSILIGSLFASHTLLAYPIVSRMGVVGDEAIAVTIGATIFTDIGALLVLAVCIGIHGGNFSVISLLTLLVSLAIYTALVLIGFKRLGKEFFRRSGDEEGNQFLFVLLVVFLSALGAQIIGVEKIVGAFLAGLAVNEVVGDSPVKEKVVFVGSVLFIPIFFVDMGLLIDIPAFIKSLSSFWLTFAVVTGLIASKFLAAFFTQLIYKYSRQQMLTMWSLSLPQVAATLAATLVGYQAGLLTENILNSVIVLMLVTATLGPLLTTRFASNLIPVDPAINQHNTSLEQPTSPLDRDLIFTVVVPVSNPKTEHNLIEMATAIAKQESGQVIALAIAKANVHMDAPDLNVAVTKGKQLLASATEFSQNFGIIAEPILRIDDDIAQGINRTSREQNADLILMGWSNVRGIRARLFGSVIDRVMWATHCPVVAARLLDSPSNMQRLLVPIGNLSGSSRLAIEFARILAQSNGATITFLHIRDRRITPGKVAWMQSQLELMAAKWAPGVESNIQIAIGTDVVEAIARAAKSFDLVILRSRRHRTTAGGLAISDITTQLMPRLTGSVVILGEPHINSQFAIDN
ncbi:MAG: cation:proton antiporter [Cyanosarcina radialis HA8281-LM2]|jgi:Kef-type K+ transport system membrane component KefB/nucleotide-binding universal stress UspA family protein|nr:cation:proton antiporter [Cyanosarcina radialis HA8281-LM2]